MSASILACLATIKTPVAAMKILMVSTVEPVSRNKTNTNDYLQRASILDIETAYDYSDSTFEVREARAPKSGRSMGDGLTDFTD